MRAIFLRVVFSRVALGCGGSHCVYFQHTYFLSTYPAVRSLALTAAGLPTNLPLAGQSMQVRRRQSPCGGGI
jgi:hypothetical protein